jgi:predicted TIM-barrel fold metal-dependent hydrolase
MNFKYFSRCVLFTLGITSSSWLLEKIETQTISLSSLSPEKDLCHKNFDVHYHLPLEEQTVAAPLSEDGISIRNEIYRSEIKRATVGNQKTVLFLTPTFSVSEFVSADVIIRENLRISNLLQNFDRAYGICGINHLHTNAELIANECIKLPKMIGFKLRGVNPSEPHLKSFKALVKIADRHHALILTHFTYGEQYHSAYRERSHEGIRAETRKLIEIMEDNSDARLIVAHSGVPSFIGFEGMDEITEFNFARNIYIETSGFMHEDRRTNYQYRNDIHATSQIIADYVRAWKRFGIERILFGSDTFFPHDPIVNFIMPQCEQLIKFTQLSEKEKQLILFENSKNLLDFTSGLKDLN